MPSVISRDARCKIDGLTAMNRRHRDAHTEEALVELRRDAMATLRTSRSWRWPPRVRKYFQGAVAPPEVTADELDAPRLRSAILGHGSLIVRGLLPQGRIAPLVEGIDRAFDASEAHAEGAPPSETSPWFVPFDPGPGAHIPREWVRGGDAVLAVDSPRVLFDIIEAFEEAGIGDVVTGYLGERPVILAKKWTLRRVPPPRPRPELGRFVEDWHQDGAFMGSGIRSINIWVALSHCGVDAPGLDLVGRRFDEIVPTGAEGACFDWTVANSVVERVAGDKMMRPVFAPGDALIFDHFLLHRTTIDAQMQHGRHGIEAWFAAPSSYPGDQAPIIY